MDCEPPDAAELRTRVEQAQQLDFDGSYEALGSVLPDLLVSARAAAAQELPNAWWFLASAYRDACGLARAVGEMDLACVAAERAVSAAERSGDQLLRGAAERQVATAFMRQGWLDEAGAVCSNSADSFVPTDATSRAGWSVWGSARTRFVFAPCHRQPGPLKRLSVRATDLCSASLNWPVAGV